MHMLLRTDEKKEAKNLNFWLWANWRGTDIKAFEQICGHRLKFKGLHTTVGWITMRCRERSVSLLWQQDYCMKNTDDVAFT